MRTALLHAILHLLAWAAAASAAYPYDCCGELFNGNCGGSATLVGVWKDEGKGLCISCGHCFDDGIQRPYIRFGEKKYPAKVLAVNQRLDLSALLIDRPEGVATVRRVRAAKSSDGILMAVGYPWYARDGRPHYTTGKYLGYSGTDVHFAAKPYLHSGFSGGGLFAPDGSYLGSTNGYGEGYSYAASGPAMVKFVSRWLKVEGQ